MSAYTSYITYDEYTGLGGIVEQSAFSVIERKAQRLLDYWTQNRIKYLTTIPDEVKEVLTEMINKMAKCNDGERLTSFSNGKVSMSFDTSKTEEQELYQVALSWLPVSLISGVVE